MMTAAEIRLKQNPILTSLLLGMGQGDLIAERLFPRLPQALASVTMMRIGDERLKRYNLRRTPGGATKRIEIKYDGVTYTVDQYSVEVPMPRELLREADESRKLQVGNFLDVSRVAMTTANAVLGLDYEIEVATLATTAGTYAAGHVQALAGATKWSAATGTPVTDVRAASEVVRKKIGKRPNTLILSPDAKLATSTNVEVKSYLPLTTTGPASLDQLRTIFEVPNIFVGDGVWKDNAGVGADVWGNNAILAYVPNIGAGGSGDINLAEPAFGFTSVMEGHPFAETPYYTTDGTKSWMYGATFERRASISFNTAGFLFQNPK